MFKTVQGFVESQVLMALVELEVFKLLSVGPLTLDLLSHKTAVPPDRLRVLVGASVTMRLLKRRGDRVSLSRRGAALSGVPGLADMIRHHKVLYSDLSDPVGFFRGTTEPELASFWPYVFGAGAAKDPASADRYSHLMSESQALVAEETLSVVDLSAHAHLLDVGGGTGAFLIEALRATPGLKATLFDLPSVLDSAGDRLSAAGVGDRVSLAPGSFRDEPLPKGADVISLVRVLYDHADATVAHLLSEVLDALPKGGRLVVSEPMLGCEAGDVYYATYTLAMGTGRTRSAEEIAGHLKHAGFVDIKAHRASRPFVTTVVTASKPLD